MGVVKGDVGFGIVNKGECVINGHINVGVVKGDVDVGVVNGYVGVGVVKGDVGVGVVKLLVDFSKVLYKLLTLLNVLNLHNYFLKPLYS